MDLIGYAKITRDLTERRQAAEQLRQSDQQFRLLVQSVTDYAIYMLDVNGIVTNWNSGAQRIKGYSADEIVGQHFGTFYTPEDRALERAAAVSRLRRTRWEVPKEGLRVRKDGTTFWAHAVIDPDPRRERRHHRLRQDHARYHRAEARTGGPRADARAVDAVAEDGGDRPSHGRRGARLQ